MIFDFSDTAIKLSKKNCPSKVGGQRDMKALVATTADLSAQRSLSWANGAEGVWLYP